MRLLLINNNPAVSRLINLSAKKYNYKIEEFREDDFDLNKNFDITIIDNEAVGNNSILLLREGGNLGDIIYVGPKDLPKPVYANYFLQKPFLPTDFIDLIKKIEKLKKEEAKIIDGADEDLDFTSKDTNGEINDHEENFNTEELDLDKLDSLDLPIPEDDFQDFNQDSNEDKKLDEKTKEELKEKDSDDFDESKVIENKILDTNSENESENENITTEELEDSKEITKEFDIPQELKLEPKDTEDESGSSILDSEDINEVKHLLNENELDENSEEQDEAEDVLEKEELLDESNVEETIDDLSDDEDILEDMLSQSEELDTPQEILEEIQSLQESNKESESEDFSEEVEQSSLEEKSSIDDLNEDDLAGLFSSDNENKNLEKDANILKLQEKLQAKIVKDVKKVLKKNNIREALKGLKININISFDEE